MPDANTPCAVTDPALLLIEPNASECSERAAQLSQSHYCVARADNPRDIFLMRSAFSFTVAVLSDLVGCFALRASAQIIRGQWPHARILILGNAPSRFEDHLYDDAVLHKADQTQLVSVIKRLTEDRWNQRGADFPTGWLLQGRDSQGSRHPLKIQESDPTKVAGSLQTTDFSRDGRQLYEGHRAG